MTAATDTSSALLRRALDRCAALDAEVHVGGGWSALTRFGDDRIHQAVEERWHAVRVRVEVPDAHGTRTAAVSTTDTTDDGLDQVVARAASLARQAPVSADAPPLLYVEEVAPVEDSADALEQQTARAGAAYRADQAGAALLAARERGLFTAGTFRTSTGDIGEYGQPGLVGYGNTRGIARTWIASRCDATVMVRTRSGATGWAAGWSRVRDDVQLGHLALRAIERARLSEHPRPLRAGRYLTLLEPPAVAALLGFVASSFSARAVREGTSLLASPERVDLAAPWLTLRADPLHAGLRLRPFDGEGIATVPLTLIADGTSADLARDRVDARRDGGVANGYGQIRPTTAAAAPRALVLDGGSGSVDELIARTPDGILVTRLWYQRLVDPREVRVTALTRDGVLMRRGGTVAHGVQPGRVNVGVFDLLRRVVDASAPVRVGDAMVPALVVDGFPFEAAG